jgi:hypothetical protein
MRILEHFFPDREFNLQNLRAIVKDIANGAQNSPKPQRAHTPPTTNPVSPDEEDFPPGTEPVVESVNDLHEPLGCLMKDSQGRFRE